MHIDVIGTQLYVRTMHRSTLVVNVCLTPYENMLIEVMDHKQYFSAAQYYYLYEEARASCTARYYYLYEEARASCTTIVFVE